MVKVTYLKAPLGALELAPNSMDLAMIVLCDHGSCWQKVDRAAMNQSLLDAPVPGGTSLVIRPHAVAAGGELEAGTPVLRFWKAQSSRGGQSDPPLGISGRRSTPRKIAEFFWGRGLRAQRTRPGFGRSRTFIALSARASSLLACAKERQQS